MKYENVAWRPQAGAQFYMLSLPHVPEILLEGNRGGGKTEAAIADFLMDCGRGWGRYWRGCIFRRKHKELEQIIEKSHRLIPRIFPRARFYASQPAKWVCPDGETLFFHRIEKHRDHEAFIGEEFQWLLWEELCNWATPIAYQSLMATLRSPIPEIAARMRVRATTNPYGVGHSWVKARFRLPTWRNRLITKGVKKPRMALHARFEDNKILQKAQPNYLEDLEIHNEAQRAAWIEGSWDIVSGGMFSDLWKPRWHVVRPFEIPRSWRIHRSYDWGSARPFSIRWWAQSDGSDYKGRDGKWHSTVRGDLFSIREWYGWNGQPNEGLHMLARDQAAGIVERELRWGIDQRVFNDGPADPAIFKEENGMCVASDFAERVRLADGRVHSGITWSRADNTRVAGWQDARRYLSNAVPKRDKAGNYIPREEPGVFVFEGYNEHFERTIPSLARDEKDLDDVDTDQEDHVADEFRYRCRAGYLGAGSMATLGMY